MVKISQLVAATSMGDSDVFAIEDAAGAETKKITKANVLKEIKDGTSLSSNSITTAKIADGSVTAAKLSTSAITLGYTTITSSFSTSSASYVQVTGLTKTVTIPSGGRAVEITFFSKNLYNSSNNSAFISIWDGTVGSGTQLAESQAATTASGSTNIGICMAVVVPSAGSKTYNIGMRSAAGNSGMDASSTAPALLLIKTI